MEIIKIIKEIDNPLFKRKEVEILIASEIIPSQLEVEKLLSEKFSIDKDNVKIKKIKGKFGYKEFMISANLYSSKEAKESIEISSEPKGPKKKEEVVKAQ